MNFRQLDCFLAVSSTLSFSSAARTLFLSQSAVSKQISLLESELGYPLFYRDKHSVILTPAGEYLHIKLIEARDAFNGLFDRAAKIANTNARRVTIGYDGPIAEHWIGRAITEACRELGVAVDLRRETLPRLTNMLLDGSVDIIVSTDSEVGGIADVHFQPLLTRGPCVFFAPGHPFEERSYVTVADLDGQDLVTAYESFASKILSRTGSILLDRGVSIRNAVSCADGDTAFMAVQAGIGVFVASHLCDEYATRFNVSSVDLEIGLPDVTMGLAWCGGDDVLASFAQIAKEVLS